MTWSLSTLGKYALLTVAVLAALSLIITPVSRSLVERWARQDIEMRARLAFTATEDSIARAVAAGDTAGVGSILNTITQDERIQAAALCSDDGDILAATASLPTDFSCRNTAPDKLPDGATIGPDGARSMVNAFAYTGAPGGHLVVLNDISYVETRSSQAQALIVATLVGVAVIVALIGALLALFLLRGWLTSLRQAIHIVRTGRSPAAAHHGPTLPEEIQRLMKGLEIGRTPTEASHVQWTPDALQDLLSTALPGAEVIILSNREPYIHNQTDDGIEVQTPASGLVSALEPVMRACGGTWVAHGSGSADRDTVDQNDRIEVPPDAPAYRLRRVWVTEEEQDGYYYGLANEGLWPLCHVAFVRPVFRDSDWQAYKLINERFAEAVAREARTEDPVVLVQDYHFALAPRMIRERLPKATIITFWHIPWPNAETFGICPWKEEILDGLLGSSILGFHTQFHCNNFFETVDRFIESRIDREESAVTLKGHDTLIRPYPISIEWPPKAMTGQPPVEVCRARVRERFGLPKDHKIAVGIERFDYTKGILDRMRSIDLLLTENQHWKGRFTFVQVAAPTRSKLASYAMLQREADTLAEEINVRHGDGDWRPIRLLIRHHEPHQVFELFRAADLCIVSSLHDGMNLVAKEFVASRDDDQGVLILSTFAGASREMSEALIVNPYDGQDMARALDAALNMPPHEQSERMHLMRQHVREQNVYRWAGRMLVDAARIRQRQRILQISEHAL